MKILVMGGSRFIGRTLLQHIKGDEIMVMSSKVDYFCSQVLI